MKTRFLPQMALWKLSVFTTNIAVWTTHHIFYRWYFQCILLKVIFCIPIQIHLKFSPKDAVNKTSALVQMMADRAPNHYCDPAQWWSNSQTHMCVTRSQWVNASRNIMGVFDRCSLNPSALLVICANFHKPGGFAVQRVTNVYVDVMYDFWYE